jgi:hypothetical protein
MKHKITLQKVRKVAVIIGITFSGIVGNKTLTMVHAATIDELSPGPNNTVLDSDQNLKWLRLDQSLSVNVKVIVNKSIEDIPSNIYHGFRLGTHTEVTRLVSNLKNSDAEQFINLFGITDNSPPFPQSGLDSEGWFLGPDNVLNVSGGAFKGNDGVSWINAPVTDVLYKSKANKGVYLVATPVPEPLTILGSVAALGFGAYAERKRKLSNSSEEDNTKDS